MTKCEFDHFILPLSVLGVAFVLAPVSPDTQAITVLSAANSNYVCIWVTRVDQPTRLWSVSGSATPLVNPTPSMMQGNWFVPLSLRHFFDPPRTKVKTGWRNVVQSEGFIPARTPIRLR